MLFNSYLFIFIFLPISLIIYFLLNKFVNTTIAKAWLTIASLFFYSWWNINYLPLILISIFLNFLIGTYLTKNKAKKGRSAPLIFGICINIFLLGYFKYANFFITNTNHLMGTHIQILEIILPIGISFFTFTQIAYLVDAYRSQAEEYNLLNYSLFVSFFPHLLAGPIIHHKEIMPQFSNIENKSLNNSNLCMGCYLFSIGLFKKVIIADTIAVFANNGFDAAVNLSLSEAWITSLSYSLQLYFDFSGYTDMALGCSYMFNIRLPVNFNTPYRSLNIQEFWRKWHVTLTRFMRDYIYIPLGGNRAGEPKIIMNLMITFLIGGLWHGAGWMFIFWGFLHGTAICVYRLWRKLNIQMPNILAWIITFNFVNIAWIFFRAKNFYRALLVLKGMVGMNGVALSAPFKNMQAVNKFDYIELIILPIYFCLAVFFKNSNEMSDEFRPSLISAIFIGILVAYSILNLSKISEFIYFNF